MSDPAPVTVQAHEVSPGVVSMYRKLLPGVVLTGKMMIAAGIMLTALMIWKDKYEALAVAIALIAGGPSLIGAALGFKAWQAQAEK